MRIWLHGHNIRKTGGQISGGVVLVRFKPIKRYMTGFVAVVAIWRAPRLRWTATSVVLQGGGGTNLDQDSITPHFWRD